MLEEWSPQKKLIAALSAIIVGVGFILVASSNLALVMIGHHDGQIHLWTVVPLLQSPVEDYARWARISLIATGCLTFFAIVGLAKPRGPALHGKARWANEKEIKAAGLRASGGILVGKKDGRMLNFTGSEHVMVYAPTRGGKGVGIVVPNLLNWPQSTIVLDIKKENWNLTAGFRSQYSQVFLFDPLDRDGRTARYNPFAYVNRDNTVDLYDDLQKIGAISCRWKKTAMSSSPVRRVLASWRSPAISPKHPICPSPWARSTANWQPRPT